MCSTSSFSFVLWGDGASLFKQLQLCLFFTIVLRHQRRAFYQLELNAEPGDVCLFPKNNKQKNPSERVSRLTKLSLFNHANNELIVQIHAPNLRLNQTKSHTVDVWSAGVLVLASAETGSGERAMRFSHDGVPQRSYLRILFGLPPPAAVTFNLLNTPTLAFLSLCGRAGFSVDTPHSPVCHSNTTVPP